MLGLMDAKSFAAADKALQLVVKDGGEKPIDPEVAQDVETVLIANPAGLSRKKIYEDVYTQAYRSLQENYSFVMPVSKRRVRIGMDLVTQHHMFQLIALLYDLDASDPAGVRKLRYKRYTQPVIAVVRENDDGDDLAIRLIGRTPGKTVEQELLDMIVASGVIVTRLDPNADARKEAERKQAEDAAAAAERKAKQEQELRETAEADEKKRKQAEFDRLAQEQAQAEAKRKAAEEAARQPLPYRAPPAFSSQPLPTDLVLGDGLDASDFVGADLDADVLVPVPVASPAPAAPESKRGSPPGESKKKEDDDDASATKELLQPAGPTEAELNAKGRETFIRDELHSQIWDFYSLVVQQFKPLKVLVDEKKARYTVEPTVFCINDVQHLFETRYGKVQEVGRVMLHVYPLWDVHPQARSPQLLTGESQEYVTVDFEQYFSVIAAIVNKEQFGWVLHSSRINCHPGTNERTQVHYDTEIKALWKRADVLAEQIRERLKSVKQRTALLVANKVPATAAAAPALPLPVPAPVPAPAPAPLRQVAGATVKAACNCGAAIARQRAAAAGTEIKATCNCGFAAAASVTGPRIPANAIRRSAQGQPLGPARAALQTRLPPAAVALLSSQQVNNLARNLGLDRAAASAPLTESSSDSDNEDEQPEEGNDTESGRNEDQRRRGGRSREHRESQSLSSTPSRTRSSGSRRSARRSTRR